MKRSLFVLVVLALLVVSLGAARPKPLEACLNNDATGACSLNCVLMGGDRYACVRMVHNNDPYYSDSLNYSACQECASQADRLCGPDIGVQQSAACDRFYMRTKFTAPPVRKS